MATASGYDFEREFLAVIEGLREKNGMSKKTFSERVFSQEKDANKKYHTILKGDVKAKPQRLKLGEAFEMARVLQISLDVLNHEAERRLAFEK